LWARKDRHQSLDRRPTVRGAWGKPDSREWGSHLLQSFDGVGPELAGRIIDHFGRPPVGWLVTAEDLAGVAGIGKQKAKKLIGMLDGGR
jgi:ERCC4-type nuclease